MMKIVQIALVIAAIMSFPGTVMFQEANAAGGSENEVASVIVEGACELDITGGPLNFGTLNVLDNPTSEETTLTLTNTNGNAGAITNVWATDWTDQQTTPQVQMQSTTTRADTTSHPSTSDGDPAIDEANDAATIASYAISLVDASPGDSLTTVPAGGNDVINFRLQLLLDSPTTYSGSALDQQITFSFTC